MTPAEIASYNTALAKAKSVFDELVKTLPSTTKPNTKMLDESLIKLDSEKMIYIATDTKENSDKLLLIKAMFIDFISWVNSDEVDLYHEVFFNHDHRKEDNVIQKAGVIGIYHDEPADDMEYRIVWRDFAINWYKHPNRAVTVSRVPFDDEIIQFFHEMKEFVLTHVVRRKHV